MGKTWPWNGGSERGPCWRAFDLNLSPDQVKGLEQIQQTYLRETQLLRAEIFLKPLNSGSPHRPDLKSGIDPLEVSEMNQLQSKRRKIIEYLIKVRNFCAGT
jgi:hypothetical protein